MRKQIIGAAIILSLVTLVSLNSCYYDNEEILYPGSVCDTANVTYSTSIAPVLSSYCVSCHGGATPSAGINLSNYTGVKTMVDNGKLWGSISHTGAYSPMPKGGSKLNTCNLTKFDKWIKAGAPNN